MRFEPNRFSWNMEGRVASKLYQQAMEKGTFILLLFSGVFLCLLQGNGVSCSCADVDEIEFGVISYHPAGLAPHPEGSNATVACSIYYQVAPNGFQQLTCVNGSWQTEARAWPKCRHVPRFCPRNDGLVRIYGRQCQTPCRNRNPVCRGSDERCYCDGSCGWTCISIYEDNFCPEVSERDGILVSYDPPQRRFNGYASFSCTDGYIHLSGSSRLRCMSNRQWGQGAQFECRPDVVCVEPPSVELATLQSSGKSFFLPGERRSYSCNLGYTRSGNPDIVCNDDYEWSQPTFSCSPRPCGYPGGIDNGRLTTGRFQFTDRAIYVCRDGYENPPYTLPYRTCQANGQWSHHIPVCQRVRCPEIVSLANGRVNSRGNEFESVVTFECNDGYRLDGNARRVCQGDKTWSGQETVCTEIICPDPGVPTNGYMTNEKQVYRHNDAVYYSCNDGFTMDGSVLNYCQESGEWAHPVPVCGGSCIIPSHPRDGEWTNGNGPGTSVNHKTRLGVRCNDRRFTVRLSSLECNNGEWSDSDDLQRLCKGRPCRVRSSDGLTVAYDPPLREEDLQWNHVPHDTRVRYTCVRGYRLNVGEETRCNHGMYDRSLTTPRCELVPCPVDQIAHGKLNYNSTSGRGNNPYPVHWDTRQLRCNNGYQPLTSSSGRCDDGVWINDGTGPLQCYPKPCEPIPETNIRSISYSRPQQSNGKYRNGTRVSINCVSNYVPAIENGTAFCHASRWWKAIPTCTQSFNRAIGAGTSQREKNENLVEGNSWHAIDARTQSEAQYCSRTPRVRNPWWKAEMRFIYNVTNIKIYNRLDRPDYKFDLDGAEVRVGINEDHTANLLCGEPITREQISASDENNHGISIQCRRQGVIGNIVSVHIPVKQKRELSLCEVEVYSYGKRISVNGVEEEGQEVGCVVPHVENADSVTIRVAIQQVLLAGQDVRFECKPGYDLEGSIFNHVDLVCLNTSSWNKPTPVCNPQTCTVQRLNHGGFNPDGKIDYNHGDIISFSCNDGYEKKHNETYRCDFGRTRPENPACIPATCSAPALPDHMTSSQPHYRHDTLLTVSCEVGFQLSGNQERNQPRCVKGRWTGNVNVTCERVLCPRPGWGDLSSIEVLSGVEGYVHGARIRYSCGEGWEIVGVTDRECNNGQWTGSVPECRVAAPPRCMLPERTNGEVFSITGYTGRIFDEGLPIGEQVTISLRSCNPGYTPQRYVRTGCSDVGEWTVPVPICERREILCANPGYISRVVQYVNGLDTKELSSYPHDELPEGTFLLSRCSLPGAYVMRGSANRTCIEGSWSGQEPSCVRAATEIYFQNNQPMEIRSNGTIVIYPRSGLFIFCKMPSWSGASAKWISDNGPDGGTYWIDHFGASQKIISMNPPQPQYSGRYTCQSYDGTISHSVFIQFAAIDCARPRPPTNGSVFDNDPRTQGRYPMGKQIIFTCNRGYNRDGASRSTCVFGEWSHRVPRCIRATCPELQPPHHGTKIGINRVGLSVHFMCNQGYQLQGESFLTCQPTGIWSDPLPTCVEIIEPEGPCDVITCESWQRCVILPTNVGICGCISPRDCPAPDPDPNQSEICGTDGKNYTSMCHLKARACILSIDIEEASSTQYCINGVPEFVRTPAPVVPVANEWSSSSWESHVEGTMPEVTSVVHPHSPTDEIPLETDESPGGADASPGETDASPVEAETSPPSEPRSYSFCDAGQCPTSTAEELCQNSAAIIIAYANRWDANTGVLEMEIYEVMFGEMPTWTQGSYQDVAIDVSAAPEWGCICPSFHTDEPYIIGFSQDPLLNDTAQLLHTDIVLQYSTTVYDEIMGRLEALQEPTPEPHVDQAGSSSFSDSNSDTPSQSWVSDSDLDTTTTTSPSVEDFTPGPSESSYI